MSLDYCNEGDVKQLSNSDIEKFADLLTRSGRAEYSARKALCIKIGIEPHQLGFLRELADADFALELINYLHTIDNQQALCKLCNLLETVFQTGNYAADLKNIKSKFDFLTDNFPRHISFSNYTQTIRYQGKGKPLTLRYQGKSKPLKLLPYLANRKEQKAELDTAVQRWLNQVPSYPLVCIIHGDEYQSHDMFLKCLKKYFLPDSLNLDPKQTVIEKFLGWPAGLKNLDSLKDRLCINLANSVLNCSFATLEEINTTFCKYIDPVIIHTNLLTEDWQQQGFEILNKYLEFWQNWPDFIPGQKLIVCVFIKYQIKRQKQSEIFWYRSWFSYCRNLYNRHCYQDINHKIYKQLEALTASNFKQFNRLSGIVLPELTSVRRSQVENWAHSDAIQKLVDEVMTESLIDEIRDMFDLWEETHSSNTIPMDDLAENLNKLLTSIAVNEYNFS
ncbi:hypothetical protein [Mastigocoleus sp. MO_188.B34]|uniref:hypothetical protein n=1 Tax=Mastigocoleus sp. MO_188.B34 TaxID=3036635 RepID=UPI0026113994|nr:hypothetical protein [Mastigocoleus sp. MO_188.B34]MDJ0695711.1 hypothetical protein [Mastigocoleus sp. MO_188.B34]